MPSLAKKLYDEGLHDGLQEGIQKGLQEGIQKGLQEGIQKGLQEGIQKGMTEGKLEAFKTMLLDLIEVRFGVVEASIADLIAKTEELEILEKLRQAIKKASNQKELLKEFKD